MTERDQPTNRHLDQRLERIEGMLERLIRLETEHAASKEAIGRAFLAIGKLEARLEPLERDAPVVQLVKAWVLRAVWAIVAAALTAFLVLVIPNLTGRSVKAQPPAAIGDQLAK